MVKILTMAKVKKTKSNSNQPPALRRKFLLVKGMEVNWKKNPVQLINYSEISTTAEETSPPKATGSQKIKKNMYDIILYSMQPVTHKFIDVFTTLRDFCTTVGTPRVNYINIDFHINIGNVSS